jgi:hypothetical protein
MKDQKFKIGDVVRITKRIQGHCFEIGEVVTITSIRGTDSYMADGKEDFWFVWDTEIELVVEDKPDFNACLDEKIELVVEDKPDFKSLKAYRFSH